MSSPATPPARSPRRVAIAVAALVVAVVALVLAFTPSGDSDPKTKAKPKSSSGKTKPESSKPSPRDEALLALARRDKSDQLAMGRADAPVVMIEYADYQCPFCSKFARDTEPELIRSYVGKGLLRIEWRNFPIFGKESEQAARAAWAAGRQQKFQEFHEQAYAKPHKRNTGAFAEDKLVVLARAAGVPDLDRFRKDMNSAKAKAAVKRDMDEGMQLGVTSTPAFLVNDKPILGAQPVGSFKKAIKQAAQEAGR
ncbi:MAG: thioredoxin domain-containing protein [Kitasatospora sp.]|jgi:protein-disulfide isomerase|nr:thioredoxin domain-containing protein [Kitasatospora sp.]